MTLLSAYMPLDIKDSVVARSSARKQPWQVAVDREIGDEDLVLLSGSFYAPADPKAPLANIRDPHHTLARLVALDKPAVEISAITGYSPARINTLRADPAFKELVAHYAEIEGSAKADISEQIKAAALSSLSILQERLDEDPDSFSNKELREIANAGLDRIGFGPQSKIDVRVNDTAKIIEQMAQLMKQEGGVILSQTEFIEAEYVETSQGNGLEDVDDDADWSLPAEKTDGNKG
jgi:hypothetical protein